MTHNHPAHLDNNLQEAAETHIDWELGSAYDFFISLMVLHQAEMYGLRPSWAAGVRSRLGAENRQTLETMAELFVAPVHWVHTLPEPKDAATALWTLRSLPPAQRLLQLGLNPHTTPAVADVLRRVAEKQAWDEQDLESLREAYRQSEEKDKIKPKALTRMLEVWSQPARFGEELLSALTAYYQGFFAEEEKGILPAIRKQMAAAQEMARRMPLPDLLAELSQGVHLEHDFPARVVLVPSYWLSPYLILIKVSDEKGLIIFGARPADVSLVPGEMVPDSLLRTLKAMADPTRLRILRYLASEPMNPAELSRRLRLRAPTVIHHISALRLAGLVHVNLGKNDERRYAARLEMIPVLFSHLQSFLTDQSIEEPLFDLPSEEEALDDSAG